MNEAFKNFPICVNCKYYMNGPCGLTMINPVTGEFENRRNRQAAQYRKESNPCGPDGKFFKPGKKKAEVKKKPDKVEEVKVSTAKVIEVDVPEFDSIKATEIELDINLTTEEPPKKRRRRSKQAE